MARSPTATIEENQGLVPIRVVTRHIWCHPDVPRRIGNVRKMFALCPKTSQKRGAASEIRTPDLRITSALLYP